MRIRNLLGLALLLSATLVPLEALASARVMYTAVLERERALRQSAAQKPPTVDEIRAVIRGYEALVRRYPRSGYSDNALWQAAGLALEAFERYAQDRDRATGLRLLEMLVREYPASSLVREVETRTQLFDRHARALAAAARPAVPRPIPRPSSSRREEEPPRPTTSPSPVPVPVVRPAASSDRVTSAPDRGDAAETESTSDGAPAVIREIRRSSLPEVVRVTIELDREVTYSHEQLDDPSRIFFDLERALPTEGLGDGALGYADDDVVRRVRLGRRPNETTRVVLDLESVSRYSVFTLYNPFRVVIDCERDDKAQAVRIAKEDVSAVPSEPVATGRAGASGPAGAGEGDETAAGGDSTRPVDPVSHAAVDSSADPETARTTSAISPAPDVPAANSTGKFSLSRQLGLGVSKIVIDPGHGGHDPGAIGFGVSEANLVLDVALRLEKLLLARSGFEVVMTRRSNVFVPLEQRTALANREQADLFLSIHANASRNAAARGVETYFLNFATNPEAEAVAARENSSSGARMQQLPDIVRAIALNNKLDESREFAELVQRSMVKHLETHNDDLRNLGVKQAPFLVLVGAAMPSVLAEISFVSNRAEAQLLKTATYRQRIAEALLEAILTYQRSLKRVGTVAHQ
jgi:N-acetylmuramoyl-L-alanine amidase